MDTDPPTAAREKTQAATAAPGIMMLGCLLVAAQFLIGGWAVLGDTIGSAGTRLVNLLHLRYDVTYVVTGDAKWVDIEMETPSSTERRRVKLPFVRKYRFSWAEWTNIEFSVVGNGSATCTLFHNHEIVAQESDSGYPACGERVGNGKPLVGVPTPSFPPPP